MADPIQDILKKINDLNVLYQNQRLEDAEDDAPALDPAVLEGASPGFMAAAAALQEIAVTGRVGRVRFEPVVFDTGAAQAMVDYASKRVYGALMETGAYADTEQTAGAVMEYVLNNMFLGIKIDGQEVVRSPLQNLEKEFGGAFDEEWKRTAFNALSGYQNVFMYDPANFLPEHWVAEAVRQAQDRGEVPQGTVARLKTVTGAMARVRDDADGVPGVWYEAQDEDLVQYIDGLWENIPDIMFNETLAGTPAQTFVSAGVAGLFDREAGRESAALVDAGESTFRAYGHDADLVARRERDEQFNRAFGDGEVSHGAIVDRMMSEWFEFHELPFNLSTITDKPAQAAVRHQKGEVKAWAQQELANMEADGEITDAERRAFMVEMNEKMGPQFIDNVNEEIRATQEVAQLAEAEKFAEDMQTESKRAAFIKERIKRLVTEEGGRSISNDQVDDLVDSADIEGWANLLLGVGSQAAAEEIFSSTVQPQIVPALTEYYERELAAARPETRDEAATLAYQALQEDFTEADLRWGDLPGALQNDLIDLVLEAGGLADPGVLAQVTELGRQGIATAREDVDLLTGRGEAANQIVATLAGALATAGIGWGNLDGADQNALIRQVQGSEALGMTPEQLDEWIRSYGAIAIDRVVAGRDEREAEAELGAARAGIGESFRDAFQARHPNLIITEEQLAYFDDVVIKDFVRRYQMADMRGELDTAGGIEEFIRGVVEGVDADQFITPAVIGPTALQQEEALTQLKVNAVVTRRNAERAAVAEAERLTGERAALEGVVPGLEVAAAGDEGFERFLFGELPGMREAYNTAYDDELAAREEVLAQEQAEQITAYRSAALEPVLDVAGVWDYWGQIGALQQELGAAQDPVRVKEIEAEIAGMEAEKANREQARLHGQDPALLTAIHGQYKADLERGELEAREARPDWEGYVASRIPGMRARYTREQEEREALFAPPGSETRRIMDEQQAQVEENRLAREQYDREAAQERRQRTLTKAAPAARVQRTRGRY